MSTHFIPTDRSPWAIIVRNPRAPSPQWAFEDFAFTRYSARIKAFWLRYTRRVETRVVRAWIPTH